MPIDLKAILQVWQRWGDVPGYRFVEQALVLRHFTARFQPLPS